MNRQPATAARPLRRTLLGAAGVVAAATVLSARGRVAHAQSAQGTSAAPAMTPSRAAGRSPARPPAMMGLSLGMPLEAAVRTVEAKGSSIGPIIHLNLEAPRQGDHQLLQHPMTVRCTNLPCRNVIEVIHTTDVEWDVNASLDHTEAASAVSVTRYLDNSTVCKCHCFLSGRVTRRGWRTQAFADEQAMKCLPETCVRRTAQWQASLRDQKVQSSVDYRARRTC